MTELSIAAVLIALVGWDAFRRYLGRAKDESASMTLIKAVDQRIDWQVENIAILEAKLNKVATDLGALSITQTPALRGNRR